MEKETAPDRHGKGTVPLLALLLVPDVVILRLRRSKNDLVVRMPEDRPPARCDLEREQV